MRIKKLGKEIVPFIEVFIASLIIIVTIAINRGVVYENRLRTMEYPPEFTAIGVSINMLEAESWNIWEIYDDLTDVCIRENGVITHFIDYYTELMNAPKGANQKDVILENYKNIQMIGTNGKYFDYFKPKLRSGRYFSDEECNQNVCVIGEGIAKNMFGTIEDSIGQTITLPNIYFGTESNSYSDENMDGSNMRIDYEEAEFRIVGVLVGEEKVPARTVNMYDKPAKTVNVNSDNVIIHPANIVKMSSFNIDLSSTMWIDQNMNKGETLVSKLSDEHKELKFTVNPELGTFFKSSITEKVALYVLNAFVVLVFIVTGMGMMGIQLISVARRREEIGLLMALGAKRSNIMCMILRETLVRFLLPTAVGILVGINSIKFITQRIGIPTLIDIKSVVICILITALFGASVGLYPAIKAAFLDPVNAMNRTSGLN